MIRTYPLFSYRRLIFITLVGILVLISAGFFLSGFLNKGKESGLRENFVTKISQPKEPLPPPQISGWAAWWDEPKAYELIEKYPEKITSVSPVWFMLDENLELSEIGIEKKQETVQKLHIIGVKVMPSLGSELTGEEMSPFFQENEKMSELIQRLTQTLVSLGADGLDIDLETIKEADKDRFSHFLLELSRNMKAQNLRFSVTIHAQTSKVEWEGVLGQDLAEIGAIADEVRIMAYDKHSAGTGPGAIAPISWIKEVATYNTRFIPHMDTFGLPTIRLVYNLTNFNSM